MGINSRPKISCQRIKAAQQMGYGRQLVYVRPASGCGVITPYRVAFIFGLLYILALKMQKDTVITKRGLEIFYQMHITTQYDFWSWEQIDSVTLEDRNHPELVALHISKGDRIRRLFFTREDAADIMVLAKKQKPGILVGEADPGRMIGFKRENKRGKSVRTTMKAYNFSRKK